MKCTYTITLQDGTIKRFESDKDLDSFIATNSWESILKGKRIDFTLQISERQRTIEKLDSINKLISDTQEEVVVINEDGDSETILKIPNSIGATRFITEYGNPDDLTKHLVTPFDKDEYFKREQEKLRKEGLSQEDADRRIKNIETSWDQLTEYGEEIHKLFESLINPTITYTRKNLTEEQVKSLTNDFSKWINELRNRHGRHAKFYMELPIISKQINDIYKKAGINSINGRIDMLVVDDNGVAHIYDFKVSKKLVGQWNQTNNLLNRGYWHSTKKLAAGYQLAIYRAILQQYEINVGTTAIIPIKIDPEYNEQGTISTLNNAYLDTDNIRGIISGDSNQSQGLPYTSTQRRVIETILPKKTPLDNIDLASSLSEPMTKMFPNYELETQVQRNQITVDHKLNDKSLVIQLYPGDKEYHLGKFKFYNKFKKKTIYGNTLEDLRPEMQKYVDKENSNRGDELFTLADTINAIQEGNATLEDLASDNRFKSDYCKRIFRKYCDNISGLNSKWVLISNPSFIASGTFIFQKYGTQQIEIISLTYNRTNERVNLGMGDSLLGATKLNRDVDNHKILPSTNGNIDLIKVMTLINSSPVLQSFRVNNIKSFNIWEQSGTSIYNETLLDNFNELCQTYKIKNNLDSSIFASTVESTVSTVVDICGEHLASHIGNWTLTFDANNIVEGVPWILQRMQELTSLSAASGLRDALRTGQWNFDDPIQYSYMLLGRALNKLNNYEIYIEKDPTKWIGWRGDTGKWSLHTGTYVNAPANSPSLNIQSLYKIFSVAENKIRKRELDYIAKTKKTILDFYKYNHRNRLIGGEVKYFDSLFVRDSNGNIDQSFRLRNPNDPDLAKEEADMIRMFLKVANELRFYGDERKIQQALVDGTYYEVPLALGSTATLLHNKNLPEAIKTRYNEAVNFLRLLPEQEENLKKKQGQQKVYNKYNLEGITRKNLLGNYGVLSMETDLEKLLLDMIHTYSTEVVMQEYLPRMQAIKITLQYCQNMYGEISEGLVEYIDKYITTNVYDKPIMDPQLHSLYKVLSAVKDITTASALGFNYRSGFRELLQGIWNHITRNMANAYGRDQFTLKDLKNAWAYIFKESLKDRNKVVLIDALNVDYGMANADPIQVQERLSSSKSGIKNFDSNTFYVFNRVPDMYHRLGLLIAKMMHDGCWDAHRIENDQLIYDFKKDTRFSLLSDPNTNKESKKYKEQHSLYIAMIEQFNREGYNLKDGDDLPRAYTVQEGTSIKSFAELCFGHYDKSSQMLMKRMFLGAAWLHFRTFLSAKLEQWILKPGTYNQGKMAIKYTDNGNMYVRVFTFDENGIPSVRIDVESNMKPGDKYEPYTEWEGRYMEGILYSMIDFGKSMITMNPRGFAELWHNDTKRANLVLFFEDMVWMGIMMFIIKAFFNTLREEGEYGPIAHFTESALYNSFADGNFFNIIASLGGDLNPPAYSIVTNLWKQSTSVLTGDQGLWDAAINSFGVLNDLKYVSDQMI